MTGVPVSLRIQPGMIHLLDPQTADTQGSSGCQHRQPDCWLLLSSATSGPRLTGTNALSGSALAYRVPGTHRRSSGRLWWIAWCDPGEMRDSWCRTRDLSMLWRSSWSRSPIMWSTPLLTTRPEPGTSSHHASPWKPRVKHYSEFHLGSTWFQGGPEVRVPPTATSPAVLWSQRDMLLVEIFHFLKYTCSV